jgi:hypothetical protein
MPAKGFIFSQESIEKTKQSKQRKLLSKYRWDLIDPYLDNSFGENVNIDKKFLTFREFKEFIKEMSSRLEDVLDDGWQDSSKREEFIKEAKRTLQELILKDYKGKIQISDFHKYLNRLIDVVIKKF